MRCGKMHEIFKVSGLKKAATGLAIIIIGTASIIDTAMITAILIDSRVCPVCTRAKFAPVSFAASRKLKLDRPHMFHQAIAPFPVLKLRSGKHLTQRHHPFSPLLPRLLRQRIPQHCLHHAVNAVARCCL